MEERRSLFFDQQIFLEASWDQCHETMLTGFYSVPGPCWMLRLGDD